MPPHRPPQKIHAVLSGLSARYQGILRLYQHPHPAIAFCKAKLNSHVNASEHPVPGGPATAGPKVDGVVEVSWCRGGWLGFSVVECEVVRCGMAGGGGARSGAGGENRRVGGGGRGEGSGGEEGPDEELYLVYSLGTYKILGVWDDAKVAYEEAERVGGLMMPVGFYY